MQADRRGWHDLDQFCLWMPIRYAFSPTNFLLSLVAFIINSLSAACDVWRFSQLLRHSCKDIEWHSVSVAVTAFFIVVVLMIELSRNVNKYIVGTESHSVHFSLQLWWTYTVTAVKLLYLLSRIYTWLKLVVISRLVHFVTVLEMYFSYTSLTTTRVMYTFYGWKILFQFFTLQRWQYS